MRQIPLSILIMGSATLLLALAASTRDGGTRVREIFVPQTSEFTQQHPGVVNSFDLSPDGKMLAVEFGTHVPDATRKYGKLGVWVAVWNLDTQRLVAAQQLESDLPIYKEGQYRKGTAFAKYERKLRFSPDGHMLIMLTGPRLVILSFPELKPLCALEDPVDPDSAEAQMVFTDFSVSAQSGRVAVLREYIRGDLVMYDTGKFDLRSLEVIIANPHDGRVLARWGKPGHGSSIALSPDGSLLALTMNPVFPGSGVIPSGKNNVFLLKAGSGEVVLAFNTGHEAGDAQFVASGKELITVPFNHGSSRPQLYLQDRVKVWDLPTGQMERELGYPKYGVRSSVDMAISADGEWLAVADPWHNPADVKYDRDVTRGWTRLLVWNIPSGRLLYESHDLQPSYELQESPDVWGRHRVLVRLSASGARMAVGGELISVYEIAK